MAAALKARLKRLLKKSEKQIPRGLSPLGMTRRKDLYGAPKGAPLQNAWQMPFFSSLFSRAEPGRGKGRALAPAPLTQAPSGAKARVAVDWAAARLKPCPDTERFMKYVRVNNSS